DPLVWQHCWRVLKPGGYLLSFGGTRTWHRLACDIEDAGFEIRDSIARLYGSGFPKPMDVSKAIDKAAGAEREVVGERISRYTNTGDTHYTRAGQAAHGFRPAKGEPSVFERNVTDDGYKRIDITAPATDAAKQWQGWGTALKPAFEPIIVARKPLRGTVSDNVQRYGTGALNIDGCRVGSEVRINSPGSTNPRVATGNGWREDAEPTIATGRWPTNVVLDDTQAAELDEQSGNRSGGHFPAKLTGHSMFGLNSHEQQAHD